VAPQGVVARTSKTSRVPSKKTAVIEGLFFERYDEASGEVRDPVVTLEQVSAAIRRWGGNLSDRNPANFMKDIVRAPTRNEVFPESVVHRGWTARQDTGESRCFIFVRLPVGQETPFLTAEPDPALLYSPHPVQSISLPAAARIFGRAHETWLTHVSAQLYLIHTHLALHSSLNFLSAELLQTNVGLGDAEIDAIFLGTLADTTQVLVCCEMKGTSEVLDEDQIARGAEQVQAKASAPIPVVPVGVKVLPGGLVWIVEFDTKFPPLLKRTEGVYLLVPHVQGIG
jgi:hypothetical protein